MNMHLQQHSKSTRMNIFIILQLISLYQSTITLRKFDILTLKTEHCTAALREKMRRKLHLLY